MLLFNRLKRSIRNSPIIKQKDLISDLIRKLSEMNEEILAKEWTEKKKDFILKWLKKEKLKELIPIMDNYSITSCTFERMDYRTSACSDFQFEWKGITY